MLNFPNFFSISRIILILPFIILLINQLYAWALTVFIIAALTDAVDGILARVLHQRTVLGSYLDPAADKILMAASFGSLAILEFLPGWLAGFVIGRDVMIVLGLLILRLTSHPLEVHPSLASKLTTIFQLVTVAIILFFQLGFSIPSLRHLLVWGTAIVTVISGLQYIGNGIRIWKKGSL